MDASDGHTHAPSPTSMVMVFTTSLTTPLFSTTWTPRTASAYAGTCIFLVTLASISRLITAWRHVLEPAWRGKASERRYNMLTDESGEDNIKDETMLGVHTIDERGRGKILRSQRRSVVPKWLVNVDLPRACVYLVSAGVGYLLMLAVMTMNVGYFLSVLAGLFIGELAVGRFTILDDGHH